MSTDMKTKTKSPWILHVLAYSKANNLKYNQALKDPNLKVGYVKVERVKKSSPKSSPKSEKMEMKYSSMNVESPKKVKKTRKMKDAMVEHMVEPQTFIQTESGNLQQIPEAEPKKVRAKKDKKM